MKRISLLASLTLLTFSGCAKFLDKFERIPGGFTKVTVGQDRSSPVNDLLQSAKPELSITSVLGGGLIVYAVNSSTGQVYSQSGASETDSISLVIPNGTYNFYGVGWPSSGLAATPSSTVRVICGGANGSTQLTGAATTVVVHLFDVDNCYNDSGTAPSSAKTTSPFPTLKSLNFVFCGKDTNINSKLYNSTCLDQEASSNFFQGTANKAKMERGVFLSSENKFFFTATHDYTGESYPTAPAQPYEAYIKDTSTGKQTKLPIAVSGGFGVTNPAQVPTKKKIVFTVDYPSSPDELWIYNPTTTNLSRISQSSGVPGGAAGAQDFRLSQDGNYVVFVGDMQTSGLFELYSVAIGSDSNDSYAAPVKISNASTVSPGVGACTSCGMENRYRFAISPTTTNYYVVYSATMGVASRGDLHFATVDGSSIVNATIGGTGLGTISSGAKISGGEITVANDYIDNMKFSYDGTHIIYHAHVNSGPVEKAMLLDVTYTPGSVLTVPAPTVITATGQTGSFVTAKANQKAIYFVNSGATATAKVVDMSSPGSTNFILFDVTFGTSGYLDNATLTSNDATLIVSAQDTSANKAVGLRSAGINVSSNYNGAGAPNGSSVSYTGGSLLAGGKQIPSVENNTSTGGGNHFILMNDQTHILFKSDATTLNMFELNYATLGTAGSTVINGSGVSTAATSVTSMTADNADNIYFAAAIDVAGKPELYRASVSPPYTPTRLNALNSVDHVISLGGGNDHTFASTNLFLEAEPPGGQGAKEVWDYNISTGVYRRGSIVAGDANGAGRFRVKMMKSMAGAGRTVAVDSGCLSMAATVKDGNTITTNVRIPLGPGASQASRYDTEVDVFPLATSCSGTPVTYSYPNGIGYYDGATGQSTRMDSGSSVSTVFIKDQ